jgi:glutaminyl-peptide cyclotransferase
VSTRAQGDRRRTWHGQCDCANVSAVLLCKEGTAICRISRRGSLLLFVALLVATALIVVESQPPVHAQGRQISPALLTQYEVVSSYPHDPRAFLQGWLWHDGGFYESTGLHGESTLRRVAFPSGDVVQKIDIPREHFGEGLAMVGDRLVQLTWRSRKAFIYDRESFGLIGEFPYETEGWGLTFDGTALVMSDGSANLFFLDPETYQITRTLPVTLEGRPLQRLNELEWIKGEIWANVWQTDMIVRIDPASGQVVGVLDMTGLLPSRRDDDDVLNGIAYDADADRTFVSGKRWPLLFEIRVP